MTRRVFLAGLAARPAAAGPLVLDPKFKDGFRIWSPEPGAHREQGVLRPQGMAGPPAWGIAQWYSRFTLAGAKREVLADGSLRFFDGAKAVTFDGDLILALNGHTEYGGRVPERGDPWPHLLIEQQFNSKPRLNQMRAVPFRISYRLLRSKKFDLPGFDERRHTAQFLLYITVRNGNRASKGFGDYFWFGVPMYDARYRLPRRHAAKDQGSPKKRGTGRFIFNPGGEVYASRPATDGAWVSIDKDLLPLMHEGLEAAWNAGFLSDSREARDFEFGSMNCGWEVTGPFDVAMQIRDFSVGAVPADYDADGPQ